MVFRAGVFSAGETKERYQKLSVAMRNKFQTWVATDKTEASSEIRLALSDIGAEPCSLWSADEFSVLAGKPSRLLSISVRYDSMTYTEGSYRKAIKCDTVDRRMYNRFGFGKSVDNYKTAGMCGYATLANVEVHRLKGDRVAL